MDLIAGLEEKTRQHLIDAMPADPSGELATLSLPDVLISWGTWKGRQVPARPRRAHPSAELRASEKAAEHTRALEAIVAKIETGDDLAAHLSKAVEKNRGLDRMLADVGVHHLHIADALEASGSYVVRGNDLLFVAFKPDDAYLIGIYEHNTDWARIRIVETMARNWPEAGLVHELSYVIAPTQEWNDEERLELQKSGFAGAPVVVDGKVFMTLGQSAGGTPYSATQLRMIVMDTFRQWEEGLEERLAEAERAIDEAAGERVREDWEPMVHDGWAGLARGDAFYGIVEL
jgi:hypothetical protein